MQPAGPVGKKTGQNYFQIVLTRFCCSFLLLVAMEIGKRPKPTDEEECRWQRIFSRVEDDIFGWLV